MISEERQQHIAQYLLAHEVATIEELTTLTGASESSIRRDLIQLEESGQLVRVHGGAKRVFHFEDDVQENLRLHQNEEEKRTIATYALSLIQPQDYVYLDAGTTTLRLAERLPQKMPITVVTNDVVIAAEVAQRDISTVLLGGELRPVTMAVVGPQALQQLDKMHVNLAFLGVNGIGRENGFETPDLNEAALKAKAIQQSVRSYVLADPSKFGQRAFATFASFEDVTVITTKLDNSWQEAIENLKVKEVIQ